MENYIDFSKTVIFGILLYRNIKGKNTTSPVTLPEKKKMNHKPFFHVITGKQSFYKCLLLL